MNSIAVRTRVAALFVVGVWVLPARLTVAADQPSNPAKAEVGATLFATIRERCVDCHGEGGTVEGNVDLSRIKTAANLTVEPTLIGKLQEVVDLRLMPPDESDRLDDDTRRQLLVELKFLLRVAIESQPDRVRTPIRRMNRFQYNNAVQDLFQLNVEVFPLPERMLREHGNYFQPATGKMPDQVKAGSRPLGKSQMIERRLGGVTAFPQDLRAENGFDNRGDHLTLSPLLLESFLRLGRSIVESPDFHAKTVGVWGEFFAEPSEPSSRGAAIRERLAVFLRRAFRRPVDDETLDRYATYAESRLAAGDSHVDAMKAVAAAVIASPRFFYLYDLAGSDDAAQLDDFNLASRLSFFLWGSIPDDELLKLAEDRRLSDPEALSRQVDRLLRDRKLKRFCDSFPAQWLQLERIISSTPDPELFPQFYFSKYRSSMHMMLEPLLLFETVLIENQSILQFVDSDFSYRSDLLEAWYRNGSRGNPGAPTRAGQGSSSGRSDHERRRTDDDVGNDSHEADYSRCVAGQRDSQQPATSAAGKRPTAGRQTKRRRGEPDTARTLCRSPAEPGVSGLPPAHRPARLLTGELRRSRYLAGQVRQRSPGRRQRYAVRPVRVSEHRRFQRCSAVREGPVCSRVRGASAVVRDRS
jgi:hypothetical protein